MRDRRIGRFRVAGMFLHNAKDGEGANLFIGMIVLDVRVEWSTDGYTYFAWHPDFDKIEPGEIAPEYVAEFTAGSVVPKWRRLKPQSGSEDG